MRILFFALTVFACATALAQITIITALPTLRADPAASGLTLRFGAGAGGSGNPNGGSSLRRYFVDSPNRVYFGYELLLEEKQKGTYLATFVKLSLTPRELSTGKLPGIPGTVAELGTWTNQPLPAIPPPRVVHDGDMISIDVYVDPTTTAKLVDDIRLRAQTVRVPTPPPPPPPHVN
jgi:hypothetical protein